MGTFSKFSIQNGKYLNHSGSDEPGKDSTGQGKGWDSDIVIEKSRVPTYIGLELAQKIMDIGTMVRFFNSMQLDKFEFTQQKNTADVPKKLKKKKRRTKEDRRKLKTQLSSGAMELETIPEQTPFSGKIEIEKI